ncbi:tafazzin [Grosmannia clavigera kw1407]|uniref:Tafazzin family protein n=1 Tax=Grosmannia clavigera (strain kw1407 / UAMH 11150) TaxID=655863 RepID=F0XSJ4_GROCL|nr:tafazzin [Grosmannia clavigera kw1407]EFW99315.1 tafazzin [Grosmannia clavigera kw1407]
MSVSKAPQQQPSLLWRTASTAVMATTGLICRTFLYGLSSVEVHGLDKFLALLDSRRDIEARQRGLITGGLDDPLIWGVLPWRYTLDHRNLRWGLGAHDICYKNSGQTLPTHRLNHSPLGGLFQPTIEQAVGVLSLPSSTPTTTTTTTKMSATAMAPFFSTNGVDRWPSPASFACNRPGWVHIFPEGAVHQQRDRGLRYFRWGIARLILESEPAPEVVPMFIDGPDRVMPEDREFPRFLPRVGQHIRVVFGDALGSDAFAEERARWRKLVAAGGADAPSDSSTESPAAALRREVAMRVRDEVLKLRRQLGYPDEDPALGLAETWAREPHLKRYRSHIDDSLVNQE